MRNKKTRPGLNATLHSAQTAKAPTVATLPFPATSFGANTGVMSHVSGSPTAALAEADKEALELLAPLSKKVCERGQGGGRVPTSKFGRSGTASAAPCWLAGACQGSASSSRRAGVFVFGMGMGMARLVSA